MRIESSILNLTGSTQAIKKEEKNEQLTYWLDEQSRPGGDILEISLAAQEKFRRELGRYNRIKNMTGIDRDDKCIGISDKEQLKVKLIESFIETLTGKKIKIQVPDLKLRDSREVSFWFNLELQTASPDWGLVYDYSESYYEKETMSFFAQGIIKTTTGQEMSINLQFNMTREFAVQNRIHFAAGTVKKVDPLVINYSGNLPELTENTFSFDLDIDGRPDQITFLTPSSGFLALDLNNDGRINDGSELFGPKSGNGFSDLAFYDDDANGWIDENDHIFRRLRIWTKDAQGNDYLLALGEVGIGAIYLGYAETRFSLKGAGNQQLGEIQKTGIFLKENGIAGTLQHIDLAV